MKPAGTLVLVVCAACQRENRGPGVIGRIVDNDGGLAGPPTCRYESFYARGTDGFADEFRFDFAFRRPGSWTQPGATVRDERGVIDLGAGAEEPVDAVIARCRHGRRSIPTADLDAAIARSTRTRRPEILVVDAQTH